MYEMAESLTPAMEEALKQVSPQGYKVLVAMPAPVKKIGNIFIPDSAGKAEHTASVVCTVLAMGDLAYSDRARFPSGRWCKPGDKVIMRSYSGTRFNIEGDDQEFRLINDDSVEAVVVDASKIVRAV